MGRSLWGLAPVAVVLLRMLLVAEGVDVLPDGGGRDDLVAAGKAEKDRALDLVQEELTLVPPELTAQGVVDRDLLWKGGVGVRGGRGLGSGVRSRVRVGVGVISVGR